MNSEHCRLVIGVAAGLFAATIPGAIPEEFIKTVTFICDGARTIGADFYPTTVNLRLSDGRTFWLVQAISGAGIHYASDDESFVFWTKGSSAFIDESASGLPRYAHCAALAPKN